MTYSIDFDIIIKQSSYFYFLELDQIIDIGHFDNLFTAINH